MAYDRASRNDIPERGNTVLDLNKEAAPKADAQEAPVLFSISLPSFKRSYSGGEKDGKTEVQTPRAEITASGIALHDMDLHNEHVQDLLRQAIAILPDILGRAERDQHARENRIEAARETLMNAVLYGDDDEVDHAGDAIRDLADWLDNRGQDQEGEGARDIAPDDVVPYNPATGVECPTCAKEKAEAIYRPHRTLDGYWAAGGVKYQDYQQAKAVMQGIVAGDPPGSCQSGGITWDGDEGTRVGGPSLVGGFGAWEVPLKGGIDLASGPDQTGLILPLCGQTAETLAEAMGQAAMNGSAFVRIDSLHSGGVEFKLVDEAPQGPSTRRSRQRDRRGFA